jgi:hypothetical protein
MTDWFDPSAWANAAKALGTTLTALTKICDRLATGKKGTRKLEQEVDALHAHLNQLVDTMMKHIEVLPDLLRNSGAETKKSLSLIEKWSEVVSGLQTVQALHDGGSRR